MILDHVINSPSPLRPFASDNLAGAHPTVIQALIEANVGHALPYGADPYTERLEVAVSELFDHDVVVRPVFGGTGANVVALSCVLGQGEAVACSSVAHIAVDEAGAPERLLGAKLIGLPHVQGKISPHSLQSLAPLRGSQHHAPAGVLSITQTTEMGTVYSAAELHHLVGIAHDLEMHVHMDGARLANAVAALGGDRKTLREITVGAGVDVLSFGGTKNGLMFGELVVFFDRRLANNSLNVRKQLTQLPSKMRYVSAQYLALMQDDLFIDLARHANERAGELFDRVAHIESLRLRDRPQANSLFPTLEPSVKASLQEWSFFWDWDIASNLCRWMTAWDTSSADVEAFSRGIVECLADDR